MVPHKGFGCEQTKKDSSVSKSEVSGDTDSLIILAQSSKTKDSKNEDSTEDDNEEKKADNTKEDKDKDEDTTTNSIRCKTSRAAVNTFNCTP